MVTTYRSFIGVLFIVCTVGAHAQSFQKAEMLYQNGLLAEAQKELIDVVFGTGAATTSDKPKALNLLASIAVEKNNFRAALDAWNRLIRDFPKSPEAANAKARIPILSTVLGQVADEAVNDAAARVYLRAGEFWSKGKDRTFNIDASWIQEEDAAVFWYDKAISEFSNTAAARIAYEEKMRTLIGWKDPGRDGERHGAKRSLEYLPILESTFRDYEKAFPKSAAAQAFRYQIAQAYWSSRNWSKTREWLSEIVEKDKGSGDSFYKDLAERRLKKVEF